jgi:hypothetical protein
MTIYYDNFFAYNSVGVYIIETATEEHLNPRMPNKSQEVPAMSQLRGTR